MIALPANTKIFVAREPADMRKSFDGLAGLVCDQVNQDPQSGHFFLFFNKRRNRAKIIWWDKSGYWLLCKRIERGQLAIFDQANGDEASFEVSSSEMLLILQGIDTRDLKLRQNMR